jgi:hypothetical protein
MNPVVTASLSRCPRLAAWLRAFGGLVVFAEEIFGLKMAEWEQSRGCDCITHKFISVRLIGECHIRE